MGDSAMSMMSGPHGDSGPAHAVSLPVHAQRQAQARRGMARLPFSPEPRQATHSGTSLV